MTAPVLRFKHASSRDLTIKGARIARSSQMAESLTISVRGKYIHGLQPAGIHNLSGAIIDLSGHLVLPGLINVHDHLDFALYPQLGRGPYRNWQQWAQDIYRPDESPIKELLELPREVRFWWGGIRNLLSGVTTVSQHDRYLAEVLDCGFPVHIPAEYGWAHSMAAPGEVTKRFDRTPDGWPFLIHLAEGTDSAASEEFDQLSRSIPLGKRVALVHAVGLSEDQWTTVRRLNLGIVWCPVSNLFTLGRTLALDQIKSLTNVALGTDSPLTAGGDLLDHIRFLNESLHVSPALLYLLVTRRAAALLMLSEGQGRLDPGCRASLFAVRDRGNTPANTLVELNWSDVELVIESGRIVLLSPSMAARLPDELSHHLEGIRIDGTERLIAAPVPDLIRQASHSLGLPFKLSGRRVEHSSQLDTEPVEGVVSPANCSPNVTRMSSQAGFR